MNRTTCFAPVAPGPANLPTISLVLSFFVPALTSRFCRFSPQQSSRFLIVTLVMVSFLFNCIRSHGLSSTSEWKKSPYIAWSIPVQANSGSRLSYVEEAQASIEVISAGIKLNQYKLDKFRRKDHLVVFIEILRNSHMEWYRVKTIKECLIFSAIRNILSAEIKIIRNILSAEILSKSLYTSQLQPPPN